MIFLLHQNVVQLFKINLNSAHITFNMECPMLDINNIFRIHGTLDLLT